MQEKPICNRTFPQARQLGEGAESSCRSGPIRECVSQMTPHYSTHPDFPPVPPLIEPEELASWVRFDDDDLLVIDKPGWVVCHPSKNGPWSSLVGACREWSGLSTLHLVSRLDRETSGLILLAKHRAAARFYQSALEKRRVKKSYLAILHGELKEPVTVRKPLAKDLQSAISTKVEVRRSNSARSAETAFRPLGGGGGYTLAEVAPLTGRKHQIRAHALWLGHPVVGDKLYGQPDSVFLEFIEQGWTPRLGEILPMRRQALHCARLAFDDAATFAAPLAWDMAQFCRECLGLEPVDWLRR